MRKFLEFLEVAGMIILFLAWASFWIGVLWVAVHFITKYW